MNSTSSHFRQTYGEWAVVTGASSGIGRAFAEQLAEMKFNLVLIARREERLIQIAKELTTKHNVEVRTLSLDLNIADSISIIERKTADIDVGLLVNNAGFALTGEFLKGNASQQLSMLNVNCVTPLLLTHLFGNRMKHRGRGGIITISSASAYLPIPNWAVYAASKAFVLHFSEALWYELRDTGVDVLAVCPGATKTEFSDVANVEMNGIAPEDVVCSALKHLAKRPSVVVGLKNIVSLPILKLLSRKSLVKLGSRLISSRSKRRGC